MDHPLRPSVEIHARGHVGKRCVDNKAAGRRAGRVVKTDGPIGIGRNL